MTKPLRVLLIDDEIEFVTTLAERLSLRGLSVRIALNAEEALRQIDDEQPDAMVLDVRMPDVGGLVLLQQIRNRYPHIRVLLLSAHSSIRDGIEAMRLGAVDYLSKPVQIDELIQKLSIS
jgi:DNA-binding NtrC family response regulator